MNPISSVEDVCEGIPEVFGELYRIRKIVRAKLPRDARFTLGVKGLGPTVWARVECRGLYFEITVRSPLVSSSDLNYWSDCAKFLREGFDRLEENTKEKEKEE